VKRLLLLSLLLIFGVIAAAPTLISFQRGKNYLLSFIEKSSRYQISIDELSLSWFGAQTVKGLKIQERADEPLLTCQEITTSAPLWHLLFGGRDFQKLQVVKPSLTLQANALTQPVSFIKIKRAALIPSFSFNLSFLPIAADLSITDGEFSLYKQKDLLVRYHALKVEARIPPSHAFAEWNASGMTTEGEIVGNFQSTGRIKDDEGLTTETDFVNFPMRGVDALVSHFHPEMEGLLLEGIGRSLNLALKSTLSSQELSCSLNARSAFLTAEIQTTGNAAAISLAKPGNFSLTLTPSFVKRLEKFVPLLQSLTFKTPLQGKFSIDQFNLPTPDKKLDFEALSFKASLVTEPLSLILKSKESVDLQTMTFLLSSGRWNEGVDAILNTKTRIAGQESPISATAKFSKKDGQNRVNLEATSSSFKLAPATLAWDEKLLTLTSPTTLRIVPTQAMFSVVLPKEVLVREGAASCEIHIKTLSLPLDKSFEEINLQADLSTSALRLDAFYDKGPLELAPITAKLDLATLKKIALDLELKRAEGDLLQLASTGSLDWAKQTLRSSNSFTLSKNQAKLGSGKILAEGSQIFTQKPTWNFIVDAQSPDLNVKGALSLKDEVLTLTKDPVELYLTLTDESFARLERWLTKKDPLFLLSQPCVLALTISRLNFPLTKNWKELLVTADGGFDKFAFQDKATGQQIKMNNLQLTIDKKESQAALAFSLSSQIATRESLEGKISCIGKLVDLNNASHPSIELDLDMIQFPTPILDLVSHFAEKNSLSPLFGDKLDAKAHLKLEKGSGPIELNLNSSNTRFSFVGEMKEGIFSLSEAAHAQVLMTEELSQMLLKEVNPLSISSLSSSNPLTLKIEPEGFSLPLNAWRKLSFSRARIELGQISCRNEGTLQTTLGLLKSKEFSKEKQLHLWFAPIDISSKDGTVSIERTEILINQTFEIATWGDLDLPNETVDMILGLTAQCLTKAFGIKNLPSDYVMHIPMKGKMNDVKLDTKSATAKIAALLVWQQATGGDSIGGLLPGGKGFGEILGRLATLPDRGANTPPAKHPFPWEKYKPSGKERKSEKSNNNPPIKKKNKIKKGDKPLKQLLKILR